MSAYTDYWSGRTQKTSDFGKYNLPVYGGQEWNEFFGVPDKYSSLFPGVRSDVMKQLNPSYYSDIISGITAQNQPGVGQEMSAIGSGLMGGIGRSKEFTGGRQQKAMTPLLQQLTEGYGDIEQNISRAESQVDQNIADMVRTFMNLDYQAPTGTEDSDLPFGYDTDPLGGAIPGDDDPEGFELGSEWACMNSPSCCDENGYWICGDGGQEGCPDGYYMNENGECIADPW